MSASLPGSRELPASQYDLTTYSGRVRHSMDLTDPRTLFTSTSGLERAKTLLTAYKTGDIQHMTPDLWTAKKVIDSTLHPDTGEPVLLPFRMSAYVLSNLVVTAGMLIPNLSTAGTLGWQIANQSLNVAINSSNANKSSPLSTSTMVQSYFFAVGASCSVAVGLKALVPRLSRLAPGTRMVLARLVPFAAVASASALNVIAMRSDEMRTGLDVFAADEEPQQPQTRQNHHSQQLQDPSDQTTPKEPKQSLGKSQKAAQIAVFETALSRVINATPIMVLPPLILVRLQRTAWLAQRPRMLMPVNLGLVLVTSVFALPLALGIFPQREVVSVRRLEERFWDLKGPDGGVGGPSLVEFNRGI